MSKFYVTTAIPYVNDKPHLGHAMEFLYADVLARYYRQKGLKDVCFSTGTDEHGGKIAEKAQEAGVRVQAFVDTNAQKFLELIKALQISNDRFVRTTNEAHQKRAQIIWKNLSTYIYKAKYVGLYCTGCEEFVTEDQARQNGGICPDHKRPYEKLEEENYFFKLSSFTSQIRERIENNAFLVVPDSRRNEILNVLKEGLEDISVSRPKEKLAWGIPVPGDSTQVMYVWFEALMNYLTVIGYPEHDDFKLYWPADVQVVGKGILRFHAAIWPGMLLGLGIELPKALYVHGYVTVDGQKMSKSLGNSIDPHEIINQFGCDSFRYYFLRHIPSYDDGDFNWQRFEHAHNNELANELGNALSRTVAMLIKYQDGEVGESKPTGHDVADYHEAIKAFRFDRALDEVWEQVRGLNQYIDTEKPWQIAKSNDQEHLEEILSYMRSSLLGIAELLVPFLPATAETIKQTLSPAKIKPVTDVLFPKVEKYTLLEK